MPIENVPCIRASRRATLAILLFVLTAGLTNFTVRAAVPTTISYQGKLTTPSGAPVNNGTYSIAFRIYDDSTAGNLFWEEVKSVVTNTGLFTVQLGETTVLDQSTLSMSNLFIAIKVGSDAEMTPRTRLASVPYAAMVGTVDGANGGMVIGDITSIGQVSGSRNDASGGYFQTYNTGGGSQRGLVGTYSATGPYDGSGVYGYSVPKDGYGMGGEFEGGKIGVSGIVIANGTTNLEYRGVRGEAYAPVPQLLATLYGVSGIAQGARNNYAVWGLAMGTATSFFCTYAGLYGIAIGSGTNATNLGVWAKASGGGYNYGILAEGSTRAGYFNGDVLINGNLSKSGGSFTIDHPLDPANKYLQHSFVESPDMMNIYNGNVMLDANGTAVVTMPDWFQPLNRDFRYQLTAIGAPGPNLYVSQEVNGNQFSIAGGSAGMKVSWQVTGVRQDVWANAHRIEVELPKESAQVGTYLHPELFGKPKSMGESYQLSRQADESLKQAAADNDRMGASRSAGPPKK
ncbi:MAG: hypothetical protein WAU88_11465 [Candidatus Zixiibacteriota bacterium]